MDEKPYQVPTHARDPIPTEPGLDRIEGSEYARHGTCAVFAWVELLAGRRCIVTQDRRARVDRTEEIECLLTVGHSEAEKVALVMDSLNIRILDSLYKACDPVRASFADCLYVQPGAMGV